VAECRSGKSAALINIPIIDKAGASKRAETFYRFGFMPTHLSDSHPETLSLFTVVSPAHLY
jgi:hypothetical protein